MNTRKQDFNSVVVRLLVSVCRYMTRNEMAMPRYMLNAIGDGEKYLKLQNGQSVDDEDSGWPKYGPKL